MDCIACCHSYQQTVDAAGKGEVVLRPTGKDEHYNHRAERSTESKSDPPAWLNADDAQEFEALSESADSRRQEFEAEHKKLRVGVPLCHTPCIPNMAIIESSGQRLPLAQECVRTDESPSNRAL